MSQVKSRATTVHDYRLMPESGPRYQLVQGNLHMSPAPNRFHQQIVGRIYHLIQTFLDAHPVGEVYISPFDVYLTEIDVYQPDVTYVSAANALILRDEGCVGAPDLLVEVLSRSTSTLDSGEKREVYARTGVNELWLVDPENRSIRVYRLQADANAPEAVYDTDSAMVTPLLPGLTIRVAEIFRR